MKVVKYLLIALMMLPMSLAMTSCSSEEDLDAESSQIVGTWRDSAYSDGSYTDVTFKSDGTYRIFDYDGTDGEVEKEEGTYVVSNGILTFYFYDEVYDEWELDWCELDIIDGNRITLEGIMFTKQ